MGATLLSTLHKESAGQAQYHAGSLQIYVIVSKWLLCVLRIVKHLKTI